VVKTNARFGGEKFVGPQTTIGKVAGRELLKNLKTCKIKTKSIIKFARRAAAWGKSNYEPHRKPGKETPPYVTKKKVSTNSAFIGSKKGRPVE